MKVRPKPKKISFIKLTTNIKKNNNKTNNDLKYNKAKKLNPVLKSNLLFINSPRNNLIDSTNKYNEKLLNKIKEYSLENQLLNQVVQKSTKNSNKVNKINYIKENFKDNNELKFNSLDNNEDKKNNVKKFKNRNNAKYNTERQANPFNNNVIINTTTSIEFKFKKKQKKSNDNKTKTLSKRKRREIYENNLKFSKLNYLKNNYLKRNASSNNKTIGKKKNFNDDFIINNTEENDNLNIHTSYNLTAKNLFNFYYPDIQFLSAKNMLEKKWRNKRIHNEIKEESERYLLKSEQKNNNKKIINYNKSKTNKNSKNKNFKKVQKNNNEMQLENINNLKVNKIINKKENVLSSLHKNRIIFSDSNKDALSFCEFKGFYSPDAYSYEKRKNNFDKMEENNKYLISNKNKQFKITKLEKSEENTKIIENIKNLNIHKFQQNTNSFYTKRIIYENKKKSPMINKFDDQLSYSNQKVPFINSQDIKTSYVKKKREEYSYDNALDKYKFHKLKNYQDKSESKSLSKSKSKSRSKSNLNKLKTSNKNTNELSKIILSIKTNWGNNLKIGINNIKLIDKNNKSIPIKNANFDFTKPYITKFIKGEIKKLTIEYETNYILKNIVILNGFNDTGIKYLLVENERGKIIWKGVIPKANLINIKSFYISIDNFANSKRKKILFSKTMHLSKIDNSNNNIKIFKQVNNDTLRNSRINESSDNMNKNYVLCDRVKIKLLDNYGNKNYIGLSGIQFFDNNNKLINIIQVKKDIKINEAIINLKEKRILYNLFNNKHDTISPKYMFLTTNQNAFVNIEFKQILKIKKIIIYNYNNDIYKDCATKGIYIDFYINNKKQKVMNKEIYLFKPPGEEKLDYGQILLYPFTDCNYFIDKINNNLSKIHLDNRNNTITYNEEYQYYCPCFPFGYILKIEMLDNYGNKNFIGIENIKIFNEENKEIELFPKINKSFEKENNYVYPRIYLMPEGALVKSLDKPLILSKFYNFNHVKNKNGENRVYFIFNQCIGISKISIYNYEKFSEISAKHIKILFDDNMIFEGDLKNFEINNIYFCDKKIFSDSNVRKKMNDKKNNLSQEFGIKLNEFKKNINNKINLERYVEYEEKNGIKILKLSE